MKKVLFLTITAMLASLCAFAQTKKILDFETPNTTTNFEYFGRSSGGITEVVANPSTSGNASANVCKFVKTAVAETWAGAYSNPNPVAQITATGGALIKIKVRMDHIGNLVLKLEESTNGQPNWAQQVSNTKSNGAWEILTFDTSLPSFEGPNQVGTGTYNKVVLFFDFGAPGTGVDVTSYFDDLIVVGGTPPPPPKKVTFNVDMRNYPGTFGTVYLSGNFNGWCGNCNPLTQSTTVPGTYKGFINLIPGDYEYKVTTDNWATQEEFAGGEPCTMTTGPYTNRKLTVTAAANLPMHCWNSCYGRPAAPAAISGPTTVCKNQAGVTYSTAAVAGVDSYAWTVPTGATIASGQGTNSIVVNFGTKGGAVKVTGTNSCGTGAAKSLAVAASICASARPAAADLGNEQSFSVSPNPGREQFMITFNAETEGDYTISLIDMTGRLVYADKQVANADFNEQALSLDYVLPGVYTLVLDMGGKKTAQKLVVQ